MSVQAHDGRVVLQVAAIGVPWIGPGRPSDMTHGRRSGHTLTGADQPWWGMSMARPVAGHMVGALRRDMSWMAVLISVIVAAVLKSL